MPTSRPDERETSPLLSQTAAGRRPEGKPWESQPEGGRRFTSQPDQRPTGRYGSQSAPNGTSHTSRRFTASGRRALLAHPLPKRHLDRRFGKGNPTEPTSSCPPRLTGAETVVANNDPLCASEVARRPPSDKRGTVALAVTTMPPADEADRERSLHDAARDCKANTGPPRYRSTHRRGRESFCRVQEVRAPRTDDAGRGRVGRCPALHRGGGRAESNR